jgi:predicted dehydrogenase
MNSVRLGIIGLGNIGRHHAGYLLAGGVARAQLTAVASQSAAKLAEFAAKGVKSFSSGAELIESGHVDAVIIATPHVQHVTLGIAALEAGLHVLVEKPIAAHKADAERLIAAHVRQPSRVFATMFQQRVEPRYAKIRELLNGGALGEVVRVLWVNTDWFRSAAYYASNAWRATWQGEGGGVLLNQALHNLDMLQWLLGPPACVRGFCQLGRYHDIEVEDDVTAYLEWAGGATGVFVTSTGEAPGVNRLEVTGSLGTLTLENQRLTCTRNATDMREFCRTAATGFGKPEARVEEIPFTDAAAPHATITQNFVNAILDGEPLIAPGAEGIHSLELANAIGFSSLLGQAIKLPLDGAAWERKLAELIAHSKGRRTVQPVAADDFAASFRR